MHFRVNHIFSVRRGVLLLFLLPNVVHAQVKDSIVKTVVDSIKSIRNPLHGLHSSGTVSVGYEYGVVPFVYDSVYPNGFFKASGTASADVFGLPVALDFYYTDAKAISGVNNYMHLSFDEKKCKQNMQEKVARKQEELKGQLKELYGLKQQAEQKLYYIKRLEQLNGGLPSLPSSVPHLSQIDSLNNELLSKDIPVSDSIHFPGTQGIMVFPAPDTLRENIKSKTDITSEAENYKDKADSLSNKKEEYEAKVKELQQKIDQVKSVIAALKDPQSAIEYKQLPGGRIQQALYYLKKLDVGLCYPSYSTFLINGAPVKGFNMELEKDNLFLAFTHGTTLTNLLFTTDPLQHKLYDLRNVYNFFDFNNVEAGRKITAVKIGYGKKEGTHLYAGILYGKGYSSYLDSLDSSPLNAAAGVEKNYVLELDGRFMINSNNVIDVTYGRSSVQQSGMTYEDNEKGFNALFYSHDRSNAVIGKYSSLVPRTKTKLTLSGRIIDPFFKSFGVGFMRSDNMRYEAKAEQTVLKRIRIGASYRKEQDNLLSLFAARTVLQTIGTSIAVRVNKHVTVRAAYNPVIQEVTAAGNIPLLKTHNNISNAILTYIPKSKHVNSVFNASYSYYQLSDGTNRNVFQNINCTNSLQFKKPLVNNISVNMFNASGTDSLNGSALLGTEELSYKGKKGFVFTAGGKIAQDSQNAVQYGYLARVTAPLIKHFSIEGNIEKLVIGEFYSTFDSEQVNHFPYYCYLKLTCNW